MIRRSFAAALLLLCAPLARAQEEPPPPADHVVMVSIDGLRPEFYLDASWPAPLLQHMAREGARAEAVRGIFPSVTYPSHTTLVTGALPARHGIDNNEPFEEGGQTGRWYWESSSIKVPTLWDAVKAAGRESGAVSWPVSVGGAITYNVPETWSLSRETPSLDLVRKATTPPGLLEELEREAVGLLAGPRYSMDYNSRDLRVAQMASYILERKRPALLLVHFICTDHNMHSVGRDGLEVRRAVATVDTALGLLLEAVERAGLSERTAFVITGDHGFVDTHTKLLPNVWLARAGLVGEGKDRGQWRAAFHTSGGSALLRLKDPADTAAVEEVRRIIAAQPVAVRRAFRVVERAELDAIGADPAAPLALAAAEGYRFDADAQGEALRPGPGGTHGYFPEFPRIHTGLVAWGSGVRPGARAVQLGLEDVAPLVARLLRVPFEAPDGTAPVGFLR